MARRRKTHQRQSSLTLRQLADTYEAAVKLRNVCANRVGAAARDLDEPNADDSPIDEAIASDVIVSSLDVTADKLRDEMALAAVGHPAYPWIMGVPGIGTTLCCRVIGLIPMETAENFSHFSKLRKFAGIAPGHGRLIRGQKAGFCQRLRVALYLVFGCILKSTKVVAGRPHAPARFFSEFYNARRLHYAAAHGVGDAGRAWLVKLGRYDVALHAPKAADPIAGGPAWDDLHQSLAAKNRLLDAMLYCLWKYWRDACGWPTPASGGDSWLRRLCPADFSSPELARRKGILTIEQILQAAALPDLSPAQANTPDPVMIADDVSTQSDASPT